MVGPSSRAGSPSAEEAVGAVLGLEAEQGDIGEPWVQLVGRCGAVLEPEQVGVGPPGGEHLVHLAEVGEDRRCGGRDVDAGRLGRADVNRDGHAHHLLDEGLAAERGSDTRRGVWADRDLEGGHDRCARSMADCRDCR